MTASAAYARPLGGGSGGSVARRAVRRVGLVVGAVLVVGLVWTGYKAMGAATGDVWPGTSRALPVPTDDTTLPPFLDILRRVVRDLGRDRVAQLAQLRAQVRRGLMSFPVPLDGSFHAAE